MPAHGKYVTAVAEAGGPGSPVTPTLTVPSGVRWLVDYVVLVTNIVAGTPVDLTAAGNRIWETVVVTDSPYTIDLATRYPRALQLESGETLQASMTAGAAGETLEIRAWVIEG